LQKIKLDVLINVIVIYKGPSIKDVRGRGGRRGLIQCGQGGSSDADVSTFWRKNLRIFRNLWYVRIVRTYKRGLSSADKGCQFFAILCGRLLWTPP